MESDFMMGWLPEKVTDGLVDSGRSLLLFFCWVVERHISNQFLSGNVIRQLLDG